MSKNEENVLCEKRKFARCFIIQPFGKRLDPKGQEIDNDKVFDALKGLQTVRPSFPIEVSRANTGQIKEDSLHAQVIRCISESEFCVTDFTNQNPNVMYETGYAKALGRKIIVICQNRDDVPSDLKELITVPYNMSDLQHIVTDIDQHMDKIKESVEQLRKNVDVQIRYFGMRDDTFIRERIHRTQNKIDILQTNLSIVQANYMTDLLTSLRNNKNLSIRILTLNPQSIFVNFRGQQLQFTDNIALYRGELDAALRGVHYQLREFGDQVKIRIYDDFPTQICFFFDKDILACVVSAKGRARGNCAFFLSSAMQGACTSFVEHFEYLWTSKSVPYIPS
jgi:hypothetical protein